MRPIICSQSPVSKTSVGFGHCALALLPSPGSKDPSSHLMIYVLLPIGLPVVLASPQQPVLLFGQWGMEMISSVSSDKEVISDLSDNSFNGVVELKAKLQQLEE